MKLACPDCGSIFFSYISSGQKIVFRVNALYVPLIIESDLDQDAGLIDLAEFHCGACSWGGGVRELLPSQR